MPGVGAAHHLTHQRPGTSFIVEAPDSFGGTWWTQRDPGIRSDSDTYTSGYRFKPWTGTPRPVERHLHQPRTQPGYGSEQKRRSQLSRESVNDAGPERCTSTGDPFSPLFAPVFLAVPHRVPSLWTV